MADRKWAPVAARIDFPVGVRNRVTQETNLTRDQDTIIGLLAAIPANQGGQREAWVVPPLSGPDGSCPPALAEAIWDFQTFWNGAGLLVIVDGVVDPDRSTLNRLNDLAAANPAATQVDVIVKFQGAFAAGDLSPNEVFPDALLGFYQTKPHRRLERIGRRTTTIRDESAQLIADHVSAIQSLTAAGRGEVFVYGSSSGGRNAVDLAVALTRQGIPLRWVAAMDAAYFPDESSTSPDNFVGEPTVVPRFTPSGAVQAAVLENYYQRVGNHSEMTLHGRMFSSAMGGKEVHGELDGFTGRDLTDAVRALLPAEDDAAHIGLTRVATPMVHAGFAGALNAL